MALAVLPALSVQLPPTVAFVASGPEYVPGVHDAIPENELAPTLAETGWLYQPSESGERARDTVTFGLDASYENAALVALAVLPALSVQLPPTVAFVASGPEYVPGAHDAIPENELPPTLAATGRLYQPLNPPNVPG